MNREVLERMTKEELMELVCRQNEAINSLDEQRYHASAVIEHLVRASHEMHDLGYRDAERRHCQDRLDDFVREMYTKYPLYIVPAGEVSKAEERLKDLTPLDLWEDKTPDDMKGQLPEGDTSC